MCSQSDVLAYPAQALRSKSRRGQRARRVTPAVKPCVSNPAKKRLSSMRKSAMFGPTIVCDRDCKRLRSPSLRDAYRLETAVVPPCAKYSTANRRYGFADFIYENYSSSFLFLKHRRIPFNSSRCLLAKTWLQRDVKRPKIPPCLLAANPFRKVDSPISQPKTSSRSSHMTSLRSPCLPTLMIDGDLIYQMTLFRMKERSSTCRMSPSQRPVKTRTALHAHLSERNIGDYRGFSAYEPSIRRSPRAERAKSSLNNLPSEQRGNEKCATGWTSNHAIGHTPPSPSPAQGLLARQFPLRVGSVQAPDGLMQSHPRSGFRPYRQSRRCS